ncbi:MAG: hypothetical protein O3B08_11995 [Proteobacteria bacterium]|jgi:hypothetical protein|nr:hypothetical protein [Pseudomonadota bacterium]
MRKIVMTSITALAGIAFAATAQAEGDCGWGNHVASTPKPVVTAENATPLPQTPTTTESKKGG